MVFGNRRIKATCRSTSKEAWLYLYFMNMLFTRDGICVRLVPSVTFDQPRAHRGQSLAE